MDPVEASSGHGAPTAAPAATIHDLIFGTSLSMEVDGSFDAMDFRSRYRLLFYFLATVTPARPPAANQLRPCLFRPSSAGPQRHRTPARYRPGLLRPLSIASKPSRLLRVPARASRLTLVVSAWLLALLPCGFARGCYPSSTSRPSSSSRCGVAAAMACPWPPTPWCNGRLWLAPFSSSLRLQFRL